MDLRAFASLNAPVSLSWVYTVVNNVSENENDSMFRVCSFETPLTSRQSATRYQDLLFHILISDIKMRLHKIRRLSMPVVFWTDAMFRRCWYVQYHVLISHCPIVFDTWRPLSSVWTLREDWGTEVLPSLAINSVLSSSLERTARDILAPLS